MKCLCCKNNANAKIMQNPDVYYCNMCFHVFRDYSFIDLKKYYNERYRTSISPRKITDVKKARDMRMVNIIKPWIKKDHTLFELGSADGTLATFIKENVEMKDMFCCEIDDNLASICESKGHNVVNEDFFKIQNKEYDCFMAIDVIEHLLDLDALVEKIKELKFERIITQVPTDRDIHNRMPFDGHFHYFSEDSLKSLYGQGYKLVFSYKTQRGETQNGRGLITVFDKV